MKADLERFVHDTGGLPFRWGATDCSLWVADWLVANGYPDPAADLRGLYADEMACAALLAGRGGLESLFRDRLHRLGLEALGEPLEGAVGIIGHRWGWQWGAIRRGKAWLVRWGGGVVPFRARARAMWAV